jgi:hypothetical protein
LQVATSQVWPIGTQERFCHFFQNCCKLFAKNSWCKSLWNCYELFTRFHDANHWACHNATERVVNCKKLVVNGERVVDSKKFVVNVERVVKLRGLEWILWMFLVWQFMILSDGANYIMYVHHSHILLPIVHILLVDIVGYSPSFIVSMICSF